jgi:crotonobetainyl-CoA:carnitine CoA-transferase CaiB-like acyl-CoA transferase
VNAPLAGLVVIAVEQAVAAPFCTARLADAGARVIKIERPEGDFARLYDNAARGSSSYFVWLNRGKESVVLDLAQEPARQQLGALIAGADVLVQNLKPGAMSKHPHLRRIQVATEAGLVAFPAPAVSARGRERHYGAVPALVEHTNKVLEELKANKSALS